MVDIPSLLYDKFSSVKTKILIMVFSSFAIEIYIFAIYRLAIAFIYSLTDKEGVEKDISSKL